MQALRDWSAKADMQRERMAILQYYAEERENRDAREARNANLARNVVGGMGVSLGGANSFNSFGGGLYFDNNINTLMVRLSFLDREKLFMINILKELSAARPRTLHSNV
ncbi:hypothetical protein A1D26_00530 [Ursidibacter maritimus]|nr:hypothetical protein A1D26_00530 [Ursidibacter maritimus]